MTCSPPIFNIHKPPYRKPRKQQPFNFPSMNYTQYFVQAKWTSDISKSSEELNRKHKQLHWCMVPWNTLVKPRKSRKTHLSIKKIFHEVHGNCCCLWKQEVPHLTAENVSFKSPSSATRTYIFVLIRSLLCECRRGCVTLFLVSETRNVLCFYIIGAW